MTRRREKEGWGNEKQAETDGGRRGGGGKGFGRVQAVTGGGNGDTDGMCVLY